MNNSDFNLFPLQFSSLQFEVVEVGNASEWQYSSTDPTATGEQSQIENESQF